MFHQRKIAFAAAALLIAGVSIFTLTNFFTGYDHSGVASCASPARSTVPASWDLDSLLTDTGKQAVLSLPESPAPDFSATSLARQLELAASGRLFVSADGPIVDASNIDWANETHGRYYSTQLHGLVSLGPLFKSEERLPGDVEALAARFLRNWALCAGQNAEINSRAWYEGTVIKRQANLLHALNYMRRFGTIDGLSYTELVYFLDVGAAYLLDTPEVYIYSNHGIRQDMLLAATGIALPMHPRAGEMLQTAERRLQEASVSLFTESGVWKEHAPGYVNYMLFLISEIEEIDRASPVFNPSEFVGRYSSSKEFLLASLMPDGSIPPIGISAAHRVIESFGDIQSALQARAETLAAYTDYGHAIVRGEHPAGLYLHFNAAQNLPAGKRHADDLSIILHNGGRTWITEGGHQSYEITGMRRFLESALSHNTYTLNGKHVRGKKRPELDTRLTRAETVGDLFELEGFTERLPGGASFNRSIITNGEDQVSIKDTLHGSGTWAGQFILAGDLSLSLDGKTATATAPDGQSMRLRFVSSEELSFSACKGQEEPLCGWGMQDGHITPATALQWSLEGPGAVEIAIDWPSL